MIRPVPDEPVRLSGPVSQPSAQQYAPGVQPVGVPIPQRNRTRPVVPDPTPERETPWLDEAHGELTSWLPNYDEASDALHTILPIIEAGLAGEVPSDAGPHPLGSPEFHIWQDGHRNGYKSERRMWQSFTGCKYPQDVARLLAAARADERVKIAQEIKTMAVRNVDNRWMRAWNEAIDAILERLKEFGRG